MEDTVKILIAVAGLQTLLLLFMGYVLYITNVKIEEYKETLTQIKTLINDFHDSDSKLWKEIAIILRRLVENI